MNCPPKAGHQLAEGSMKYSEKLKLLVVKDYCSGGGSLRAVAARHKVDISAMRGWIAAYTEHGTTGIKKKKWVWR